MMNLNDLRALFSKPEPQIVETNTKPLNELEAPGSVAWCHKCTSKHTQALRARDNKIKEQAELIEELQSEICQLLTTDQRIKFINAADECLAKLDELEKEHTEHWNRAYNRGFNAGRQCAYSELAMDRLNGIEEIDIDDLEDI